MESEPKRISDDDQGQKFIADIRPRKSIVIEFEDGRKVTLITQKKRGRQRIYVPGGQGVKAIRRA